ncbi:hypothetical protein [Nostoc sp.]
MERMKYSELVQTVLLDINLDEESVAQLLNLPLLHRDPFERMLIFQA